MVSYESNLFLKMIMPIAVPTFSHRYKLEPGIHVSGLSLLLDLLYIQMPLFFWVLINFFDICNGETNSSNVQNKSYQNSFDSLHMATLSYWQNQ